MTNSASQTGCAMNRHHADQTGEALTWRTSDTKKPLEEGLSLYLERETRFELATSTLARLRSTS
jgi:hypothetical protein